MLIFEISLYINQVQIWYTFILLIHAMDNIITIHNALDIHLFEVAVYMSVCLLYISLY